MEERFGAVIVAAGSSTRMGGLRSKVLEPLCGEPVLAHTLKIFEECPLIGEIVVVCRAEDSAEISALLEGCPKPVKLAEGGAQRQDSVLNGVAMLENSDYLVIHDGARPLVTTEIVERVCRDAVKYGAASAAVKVKDTCKLADAEGFVLETPPREALMAVQTPQVFARSLYLAAADRAGREGKSYTDDCQLIESAGGRVYLTPSSYMNLKITTPDDLITAEALLQSGE